MDGVTWEIVGWVAGAMLGVIACLLWMTTWDRGRSAATLRLDWFVPALRKLSKGQEPSHSILGRSLRRLTPAWFQSNHQTKQRGILRVFLRRLGISWLASPVRRIVQALCLATFMMLFFIVCWPYNAQPITEVRKLSDWTFSGIDQESGEFVLRDAESRIVDDSMDGEQAWRLQAGERVFVFDNPRTEADESRVGEFTISKLDDGELKLRSVGPLTPELIDAFLTSSGPFELCDRDYLAWPSHYADNLAAKEFIPAETFLMIDPLVGLRPLPRVVG